MIWLLCIGALGRMTGSAIAQAEDTPRLEFVAPAGGSAIRGETVIVVDTDIQEIQQAELWFRYNGDPIGTWFPLWESDGSPAGSEWAVWDTTAITDGNYDLRLVVWLPNGEFFERFVSGIRVRNYSPIETSTPAPAPVETDFVSAPTISPSQTPVIIRTVVFPSPAPNPASLTTGEMLSTWMFSVLGILGIFGLLGVYLYLRQKIRGD